MLQPSLHRLAYRLWNYLAKRAANVLSYAVSAVCFYCVFTLAGLRSSSQDLAGIPVRRSLWTRRVQVETTPDSNRYANRTALFAQSNNKWALCLAPFVLLLEMTEAPADSAAPADIYTLF